MIGVRFKLEDRYAEKHGVKVCIFRSIKWILVIHTNGNIFEADITDKIKPAVSMHMLGSGTTVDIELNTGEVLKGLTLLN